jgi:hypothetical protein
MRQKHAQCDLPLLRHQLASVNDLDFGEFLRYGISNTMPVDARDDSPHAMAVIQINRGI